MLPNHPAADRGGFQNGEIGLAMASRRRAGLRRGAVAARSQGAGSYGPLENGTLTSAIPFIRTQRLPC